MGVVYRGERLNLGRPVAVKFLSAQLASDPVLVKRFEVEARAMGCLAHPNCVSVIDFGIEGTPYLVMDFVAGPSLREVLAGGPLPATRAIRLARQILAALQHAHAMDIVHRDIKPENVLVESAVGTEENVRVVDFGLAKFLKSQLKITMGAVLGTPNYMAPELTRDVDIDGRVDTYATGIVLFEMLTGRPPFDGRDIGEIFVRMLNMPPPPLRKAQPDKGFSAELEAVLLRSMAKERDLRYPSAAALSAALDEVPEAHAVAAVAPRAGSRAPVDPDRTIAETLPAFLRQTTTALREPSTALPAEPPVSPPMWRTLLAKAAVLVRRYRPALTAASRTFADHLVNLWERIAALPRRVIVVLLGSLAALAALVAIFIIVPDRPPRGTSPAATSAKPAAMPPVARSASPGKPAIAGERQDATERLLALRRAEPRNAKHAAALARLYFEKGWWSDGFAHYRAAVDIDPKLKSDPVLLEHLITALGSDKVGDKVAAHLQKLGPSARPSLKAAASSHPDKRVRTRAAEILRPARRKSSGRWFSK